MGGGGSVHCGWGAGSARRAAALRRRATSFGARARQHGGRRACERSCQRSQRGRGCAVGCGPYGWPTGRERGVVACVPLAATRDHDEPQQVPARLGRGPRQARPGSLRSTDRRGSGRGGRGFVRGHHAHGNRARTRQSRSPSSSFRLSGRSSLRTSEAPDERRSGRVPSLRETPYRSRYVLRRTGAAAWRSVYCARARAAGAQRGRRSW